MFVNVSPIAPTANANVYQAPKKFVDSTNDGHLTCCLYLSLNTGMEEYISSLTGGTLMSKSADSIWYDGYDINNKTKNITLRDSVWCRLYDEIILELHERYLSEFR